jgi:hypothetical protein
MIDMFFPLWNFLMVGIKPCWAPNVNALLENVTESGSNMMVLASRIWVSIIGVLSILTVFPHWFRVEGLVAERGVQAMGHIGRANIRADMGGMFLAIGVLALIAACKRSTTWLLATMIVPGSAIVGRFVSLATDGYEPRVLQPIIVEAVVLIAFLAARKVWTDQPVRPE